MTSVPRSANDRIATDGHRPVGRRVGREPIKRWLPSATRPARGRSPAPTPCADAWRRPRSGLRAAGIGSCDCVAIMAPNRVDNLPILHAGGVVVPVLCDTSARRSC